MSSQCRDLEPLLTPYVDGEVAAEERASVDAHLRACPPCRDRVAGERAVREVLQARRSELRPCVSDSLRARCEAHRTQHRGARAAAPLSLLTRRALVPLSLAASLVLAVVGVFLFGLGNRGAALAAHLTQDHISCFESKPSRSSGLDARVASREWSERHGWLLQVPSSSPTVELELVAVRRCLSADGGTAHVMYRWRGEPLSLYVLPRSIGADDRQAMLEKLGGRAIIWVKGSRTYVLLTRADRPDLDRVATHIRNGAE